MKLKTTGLANLLLVGGIFCCIDKLCDNNVVVAVESNSNFSAEDLVQNPAETLSQVEQTIPGYPLLDAVIAAGAIGTHRSVSKDSSQIVSLNDILEAHKCFLGSEEQTKFLVEDIPHVLHEAMNVADTQVGRILETADQILPAGENYVSHVRGVAFPCTVMAESLLIDNSDTNLSDFPVALG